MQIEGTAYDMPHLLLLFHVDGESDMVWLRGLGQTTTSCGHMFQPRGCRHLQVSICSPYVNSNTTCYTPQL